jgi:uncharacterized protein YwqG
MIPIFLDEFKSEIEKYKLDTIKIKATPITKEERLSLEQSKFLGKPFLPANIEYPKNTSGIPMILLAQINFAEAPKLENYPSHGILQLFVSGSDWYDMGDYQILFHENINQEHQTEFPFLTSDLYEESPIGCEHKLSFIKGIEYGGLEDFRFQLNFNGKGYYDYQEGLSEEQQKEMDNFFFAMGHKIGGYAYFTQSDPREYDAKKKNDLLLFQIDTDDKIMFGDSGVANVFLNVDDLKNKNFEKAYFNWDCC